FDKVMADCAEAQGVTIDYQHELIGINFAEDHTILDVQIQDGERYQLEAQYVLDGSGFGRVLPKMLDLEEPSRLPPRKAIFTHVNDHISATDTDLEYDRSKILVSVHPTNPDV
ncbi:NAD(P)/FAD-dependent oxidoreductase, partial [Vibrio sp. 10N.261.45.F1]